MVLFLWSRGTGENVKWSVGRFSIKKNKTVINKPLKFGLIRASYPDVRPMSESRKSDGDMLEDDLESCSLASTTLEQTHTHTYTYIQSLYQTENKTGVKPFLSPGSCLGVCEQKNGMEWELCHRDHTRINQTSLVWFRRRVYFIWTRRARCYVTSCLITTQTWQHAVVLHETS